MSQWRSSVVQSLPKQVNILFTSAGRRVELLRAFRQAYRSLGLRGNVVALDIDPLAPALQVADRPYITQRLSSPSYIPTLIEICNKEHIDAIFPLIDPDIPTLAQHRERIEETGARLAVISLETTAITEDKWCTVQFLRKLGLPTPQSWVPDKVDIEYEQYPLFIKPRSGSAAKSTYKVTKPQELAFFTTYVPDPIIQEYLPGPEITSDVICDLTGKVLGVISRQRIEVRWGEVAKGVTVYDPAIVDACVRIANALPAIGPITVQCILKDGVPHYTEINARLGGGVPLGIAAGADSPRWVLASLAGLSIDIPPIGSYQTGLYLTRFDESFFITDAQRKQMASCHL